MSAFSPWPDRVSGLHSCGWAALPADGERPKGPPFPGNAEREGFGAEGAVLLIDDEIDSLDAVRELLESEGLAVWTAEDGATALDLLRRGRRPHLIVLDLRMPRMDGWEFCRELGADERLADIPVAIVTASASFEELPPRRQDAGFFTKPVDFEGFLRVVKRYCV